MNRVRIMNLRKLTLMSDINHGVLFSLFAKNRLILAIVGFIFLGSVIQSDAQTRLIGERSAYTQYFLSPYLLNPGATGQNEYSQVLANYRNAWSAFPGSPKTITVGYEGPIGNRIGIGLIGLTDSFASLNTSKGALSLSYTIETPDNKIGVGLSGEYIQHKLDGDVLVNNPFILNSDPEILATLDGSSYFDATIGVYGVYKSKIIYGVAFPSLVSQKVSGPDGDAAASELGFIANVGYRMEMPEKDLIIEPSIYAKKLMLVPFHVDVNIKADFLGESLTTGLTYSVGAEERLGFLIGTRMSNFSFHYSYNMSFHEFQQYNNGSHELGLRLRLMPYSSNTPQ